MTVDTRRNEWNSHQRGAWIALWLWQGSKLSNRDVARLCGVTTQAAGRMMMILSAVMPIDRVDGKWQWINKDS